MSGGEAALISRFGSGSVISGKSREGWRLSKSSVSSIYHSAQDVSDFMSDCYYSDDGEPMSPFRSYHSIQESIFDTDREDIFSSPRGSMTFHSSCGVGGHRKVNLTFFCLVQNYKYC